jgi:hypothetical protein
VERPLLALRNFSCHSSNILGGRHGLCSLSFFCPDFRPPRAEAEVSNQIRKSVVDLNQFQALQRNNSAAAPSLSCPQFGQGLIF